MKSRASATLIGERSTPGMQVHLDRYIDGGIFLRIANGNIEHGRISQHGSGEYVYFEFQVLSMDHTSKKHNKNSNGF
jgi:hypothetical protein